MTLFTDLPSALARARERSAAKASDEAYLTELLHLSVGIHRQSRETVYRPFYVAARWLQQSRRDQSFKEADGAKFTGQVIPIESLLDLQRSLDLDLDIPTGFQAVSGSLSKSQLESMFEEALLTLMQFQPRGFY
jgi:hypothetical protein